MPVATSMRTRPVVSRPRVESTRHVLDGVGGGEVAVGELHGKLGDCIPKPINKNKTKK